jgi:hypothetical protein
MPAFLKSLICLLLFAFGAAQAADDGAFAVIAHAGVARVDAGTLQRLYTGRAIEVGGMPVTVVNLAPGVPPRERFLWPVLNLDNDRYVAYWTVRRHVGKGVPPREFRSAAELIDYVQATPGAIGYVAAAELRPGLNVVYRP